MRGLFYPKRDCFVCIELEGPHRGHIEHHENTSRTLYLLCEVGVAEIVLASPLTRWLVTSLETQRTTCLSQILFAMAF
jgi:hypothetical protein